VRCCQDPRIVQVLDRGELPDRRPFFVMEYVKGRLLREAIPSGGMNCEFVAQLVRQIGKALTAVHGQGVIHRDLNPRNIKLQSIGAGEEQIKLIDFGIAKVKDSEVGPETSDSSNFGTIPYLAPEQLANGPITAATDVFAFGVIAYEMLTGQCPFNPDKQDSSIAARELLAMQEAGPAQKPSHERAALLEAVDEIIFKALSFDPAQRYQQATDFSEELAQALVETGAGSAGAQRPARQRSGPRPVPVYTLFADIVEHGLRDINQQKIQIEQLNRIVRGTSTYRRAKQNDQLNDLPRGDAIALVFFEDAMAAIECAIEIAKGVQAQFDINLRIGLHTGPVRGVKDIRRDADVAGGGINYAQRVAAFGDAGHILLSRSYADFLLQQRGHWTQQLRDLGEHTIKHEEQLHLYNYYNGEVGNLETPASLRPAPSLDVSEKERPKRRWPIAAIAAAILVVIAAASFWILGFGAKFGAKPEPPAPNSNRSIMDGQLTPVRLLNYSLLHGDDGIRFDITASQIGYLYLLNEGPRPLNDGKPKYTVLFPSTADKDASALIEADQRKTIPRTEDPALGFTGNKGTEKLWLIWSASRVAALEAVKQLNNPKGDGVIRDADQIARIQKFLSEHPASAMSSEKIAENQPIELRSANDVGVHLLTFEHR